MLLTVFLGILLVHAADSKVVPVSFRPGVDLRRDSARLLKRSSEVNLGGSVDVGYFFAHISLGTPPQTFSVIADTGSPLTYVPCRGCDECGDHEDAPFDTSASTTFHQIACDESTCSLSCTSSCCTSSRQCRYTMSYTEGSSVTGNLVQDSIRLPAVWNSTAPAAPVLSSASNSTIPLAFGCNNMESGEIYRQAADGITGLSDAPLSIVTQLAQAGVIEPQFTLCFGAGGGGMVLGSLPQPLATSLVPVAVAPRSRSAPFYNIRIQGLKFGDELLNVDLAAMESGYGTIVDSGTTFTFLPTQAHTAFVGAFADAVEHLGYILHRDHIGTHCFSSETLGSHADLAEVLPNITLVFDEGSSLPLTPKAYLFQSSDHSPESAATRWCLGILNGGPATATIGAITMREVAVTFDNARRHLRFRPVSSCQEFASAVSAAEEASMVASSSEHASADAMAVEAEGPSSVAVAPASSGRPAEAPPAAQDSAGPAPIPAEAQDQPADAPCCDSIPDGPTLEGNGYAAGRNRSTEHNDGPDVGSNSTSNVSDVQLRRSYHWSKYWHQWRGRLGVLGLCAVTFAAVMCCRWGAKQRAHGYTELVERKGRHGRAGCSDLEAQGTKGRAYTYKERLLQNTLC